MKKYWTKGATFLTGLLAACLCLAGCGQQEAPPAASPSGGRQLVIQNFDFEGRPAEIRLAATPKRVLVARPEVLDALLAIHAEDAVCAAYVTKDEEDRIPEFQAKMPQAHIYTNEIDRETALMEQPDLIIGWRRSFQKGSLGDIPFWQERHIPTYIEENSGPVPAVDPFPPSTVESEIQFLTNMGRIFHREKEAAVLTQNIEAALQEGNKKREGRPPQKALTIEFMRDKIEVFGDKLLSGDMIRKLGSKNLNYETPFISREELRVSDADVIFVIYHGDAISKRDALAQLSAPEFQDIPAVAQGRVYFLPYRYVCASNVYTAQCIREIANGLYQ